MIDGLLRLDYDVADASGATTALRAVAGEADVTMRSGPLRWVQESVVDDGITVSRVAATGDAVEARFRGASELTVVQVREGSLRLRVSGRDAELRQDDLGLIPAGAQASLRCSRARFTLVSLPRSTVARLLGVPKQAVHLHAPLLQPASADLAAFFRRCVDLLESSVFGVPGVYDSDLVRTQVVDALSAVVIEAFELTNRTEDDTGRDLVVLRRALAELRSGLGEPVSIPEVAAAAGVSVRGLQLIFQRQMQVTPLLQLRRMRMEAAHQALLDEARVGVTVAEVGRRFGYANAGRFSTHYRDLYGESPARVLQRIRDPDGRPAVESADGAVRFDRPPAG